MRFVGDLDVRDRTVVVCGGSTASLAIISTLIAERAKVVVVAPNVPTTVADLAGRAGLDWRRRLWSPADLDQAGLVVASTGDPDTDQAVRTAATTRNLPCLSAPPAPTGTAAANGEVILVGGGPGDPGLLTVAGLEAVRSADVIVCDRLAPLSTLSEAKEGAQIVDVAKIPRGESTPQEVINRLLVEHASAGRSVVRFKGGDSFVFGRGGEEWQACAEAGINVRVIPGVTSAVAAPALAGIPLTHRDLTQGFTVVSGHLPPGAPGSTLDWEALAAANTTLVIMMGVATLPAITAELRRHRLDPATPAATVASAGMPGQRVVRGTLASIAEESAAAGIRPPAITVIGAVAGLAAT